MSMRNMICQLSGIGAAALLALTAGCASTRQTEDLLSAAGFKSVPATTPEQQAHLKTLPARKVTVVERNGKTYFVYPDVKQNMLYVGQQAQYQQYQKLREQYQMALEQENAAEMRANEGWGMWGPWAGPGWW
jgi:hypothetical protein